MSQPLNEIQTPSHDCTFTPMATIPSLIIFLFFLYFALLASRHIAVPGLALWRLPKV
jgi:hypothetical protein